MYYSPYTCKIYFQKVSLFYLFILYVHFLKKLLSGQKHCEILCDMLLLCSKFFYRTDKKVIVLLYQILLMTNLSSISNKKVLYLAGDHYKLKIIHLLITIKLMITK